MLLLTDFDNIPSFDHSCGLTIGSFDGVHLGHQALISHLKAKLLPDEPLVVLTFSNHPSYLFYPHSPTPLIYPPLQKVKYLAEQGADIAFLIPFDAQFARISYEDFLKKLKQCLNFTHLCVGRGAVFGKNREGNETNIKQLAEKLHFKVDYLQKYLVNGLPVSSGRIRTLITQGKFLEVKECLGRPYSLMGALRKERNRYHLLFSGICLPPDGTYAISLKTSSQTYECQAQVLHNEQRIDVSLSKDYPPLVGKDVEIIFNCRLKPDNV